MYFTPTPSTKEVPTLHTEPRLQIGMIIDPTIRFETYKGQPEDVHEEKRAIYVPTILYYKDKYQLHDISVTGLMFGARGTISNFSSQFWEEELLLLVAIAEAEEENRRRRRRLWIHNINTTREEQGEFYTLVPQLIRDGKLIRMTIQCFDEILGKAKQGYKTIWLIVLGHNCDTEKERERGMCNVTCDQKPDSEILLDVAVTSED
ncbi:hypothetical protein ANN_03764 [Periplaneta americana]|uniref:Uncharacterized protein n=1 Tax=Periplaneta americana TaxID=6978 RepID=A0ABQ8TZR7_PERAM|nr:hypothetical protein ANN_03764 [Periplaneta americana]